MKFDVKVTGRVTDRVHPYIVYEQFTYVLTYFLRGTRG